MVENLTVEGVVLSKARDPGFPGDFQAPRLAGRGR
jgi:hypothetical protein